MRFQVLVIGLLTGCGYKAEIASLQADLVSTRGHLVAREAALSEREAAWAALEQEKAALASARGELESALSACAAERDAERERAERVLLDRGALKEEVDQMRVALTELEARKRQAEARVAEFRELVARFRTLIDAGTLDVRIVDGRMVLRLATDILFASGSSDLSAAGRAALTQVAAVLAGLAERRYQVEGHTDDVPIQTARFPSNWYLAAARAIGVSEALAAGGLPPERVSAAAFGEYRPVAPNLTDEGRAANRRIEIVVVPDLSELPGYEELAGLE